MTSSAYEIRQCADCGLRYPIVEGHPFGESCPACGGKTRVVLRRELVTEPMRGSRPAQPPALEALLDNVRSAWNVGSMFRTADGFGVRKLHLCGITPTPENEGVRKTALGAEQSVPWESYRNALDAACELRSGGRQLWALEHDPRARALPDFTQSITASVEDVVLIAGNEITGVDPQLLDLCDQIIHIPMRGTKRSFNVAVAFGIAVYNLVSEDRSRR